MNSFKEKISDLKATLAESLDKLLPYLPIGGRAYRMVPTRYGLVYLAMLLAVLIGSINHNNNLGYLLSFFLGSLFLVSLFYTYRNLRDLTISGIETEQLFAGQNGKFQLALSTTSADPLFSIVVALGKNDPETCQIIEPHGTKAALFYPLEKRGMLQLTRVFISTTFPLGLMKLQALLPADFSGVVYPQPIASPYVGKDGEGNLPEEQAIKRDAGRDFTGLERYAPGDNLNQIHWKSFAAGRGLNTKHYEDNTTEGSIFSLQGIPGANLERKLSQLTYMILNADATGIKYGLKLGKTLFPANKGLAHKKVCLEALALY